MNAHVRSALAKAMLAMILGCSAVCSAMAQPAIVMKDMQFSAPPEDLKVGETLTFTNADVFQHSATSKGEFDLDLKPGESGSIVLKRAGTIEVFCRYHPTMKFKLVVAPSSNVSPIQKGHER